MSFIPHMFFSITSTFWMLWQEKLITSLALPRALLKIAAFSIFCYILLRLHFFDKFHQQINHLPCLYKNYMQEKCFTQVNSINKRLIRRLCMEFLLYIPSSYTKLGNFWIYSLWRLLMKFSSRLNSLFVFL